tara:strand:+ start:309822 stop:311153 length:1332 start_codon:yes stop_codon:yes gene_type:complete
MNTNDPRLELARLYVEGEADAEATRRLEDELRKDAEFRSVFLDYLQMDLALSKNALLEKSLAIQPAKWQFPSAWIACAAAVLMLVGFSAASWWMPQESERGVRVTVLSVNQAKVEGAGELVAGTELSLSQVRLTSGHLRLGLSSDVRLELVGPLEGQFVNDMRFHLRAGLINAEVGERGKGFTVESDAGEIIDRGTSFGMQVDRSGESRVAVFSGTVEVHPRKSNRGDGPIVLTEGLAARFSAQAGLRRWREISLAARAAGLAANNYAGIIESVHDNLGNDELQPFYGVVQNGMSPGALAFTDKPNPSWAPRPGDKVPDELLDADLIRTYHQFRRRLDYELTVNLRDHAAVYVLIKSQDRLPDWLSEKFTNTGKTIVAGPFQQSIAHWPEAILGLDGLPYFEFSVWKASVAAGEFTLGSPRATDLNKSHLMYGIAVQPRETAR